MTLVVPYDGSELADAALVRAGEFGAVLDEDVLAVTVVPEGNTRYARERGWLAPDEPFSMRAVVSGLEEQVEALCPDAAFRHLAVDRGATRGSVSNSIRRLAREEEASIVFVGSENAGRIVNGMGSVGTSVTSDRSYDVLLVRRKAPSRVAKLEDATPDESFYASET